ALDAQESRVELAAMARFIFAPEEADVVVPLRIVLVQSENAVVAVELKRRSTDLARLISTLHPFYRNAGLSLGAAFAAARATPAKREAACAQFEADWQDAVQLEAATTAALDALERRGK
ncbi:MAG: hypothetical protein V4773_05410, partial [Verrucomicrobiota bacterium]